MKTLMFLLLLAQAADIPPKKQDSSSLPADVADAIKKTVTRVTAYGEQGRLCEARWNDDLSQMRDIDSKAIEAQNRVVALEKEGLDANARGAIARSRSNGPALAEAQQAF